MAVNRFGGGINIEDLPEHEAIKIINVAKTANISSILQQMAQILNEPYLAQIEEWTYTTGSLVTEQIQQDVIVDIVGLIKELGWDSAKKLVISSQNYSDFRNNSPMMVNSYNKFMRDLEIIIDKDMGVEGLGTCSKCKGTKVSFYEKRTRGGDEAVTVFVTCVACGHRWKQ